MEEFKKDIDKITKEISDLLVKKRKDYGTSFDDIWREMGAISVVVRLRDKIARLQNLIGKNKTPSNESIEDSFRDICGYSILSLRMLMND